MSHEPDADAEIDAEVVVETDAGVDAASDGAEPGDGAVVQPDASGGAVAGEVEQTAAGGGQSWSWYLVRVSGLFLAVLLPLHFAVVILRDDVGHTTLATVTARFADARWQAVELVTLLLALLHGFLALRTAVVRSPRVGPGATARAVVLLGVVAVLLAVALVWAMLSLA